MSRDFLNKLSTNNETIVESLRLYQDFRSVRGKTSEYDQSRAATEEQLSKCLQEQYELIKLDLQDNYFVLVFPQVVTRLQNMVLIPLLDLYISHEFENQHLLMVCRP